MTVHKQSRGLTRRALLWGLAAAGGLGAAESLPYREVRNKIQGRRLLIVPYSHMDLSWVHSEQWQADRAAIVISEALDALEQNPEYRFFVDTWNEFVERFLERRPERIPDFRRAVADGRMAICGGTVCNQHPSWMETESLVRDMTLGRKLFRRLIPDFEPGVMVHNDVTPGPAQMPQILRLAGYHSYRFFRPDASLSSESIPIDFEWVGLDGSTILVSRGAYGGLWAKESVDGFENDWKDAVERFYAAEVAQSIEPESGGVVWVPMGADDSRPLRAGILREGRTEEPIPILEFAREWNRREAAPLEFATPEEYFALLANEEDFLPRHEGVLDPTMWTFWYGINGNDGLRMWRTRADQALVEAETVSACAASLGEKYPESAIEGQWLEVLRATSHAQNWLFAADYDRQLQRVKNVREAAEKQKDAALAAIASRVAVRDRLQAFVLWNPLPWDRTEVVELWATFQDPTTTNFRVVDASGDELPFQVVDLNDTGRTPTAHTPRRFKEGGVMVKARIPALGYTTVYVEPISGAVPVERTSRSNELDAGFAHLKFSSAGIESLTDAASAAVYAGAGNVIYNEIDDIGPLHYGPVTATRQIQNAEVVSVFRGDLYSRFTLRGSVGEHPVELGARLYPHSKRIAFETVIDSKGGSGHFMTKTGLPGNGDLSVDIHFGLEPRDPARTKYGQVERLRENVFYGAHWAHWAGVEGGLTMIATTGEKGYQYFPEEPGLGHFLLMTMPPDTSTWERFVTKAREGRGRHRFDYQLLLHSPREDSAAIARRALEARYPVRPVRQDRPLTGETLPESKSFLSLEPGNLQMSAFFQEDGAYRIRLFETAGESADATVRLPFRPAFAECIDFHGEPLEQRPSLDGDMVRLTVKPWQIVTLRVD